MNANTRAIDRHTRVASCLSKRGEHRAALLALTTGLQYVNRIECPNVRRETKSLWFTAINRKGALIRKLKIEREQSRQYGS